MSITQDIYNVVNSTKKEITSRKASLALNRLSAAEVEIHNVLTSSIQQSTLFDKMKAMQQEQLTRENYKRVKDFRQAQKLQRQQLREIKRGIIAEVNKNKEFQQKILTAMENGILAIEYVRSLFIEPILYRILVEDSTGVLYEGKFSFEDFQKLNLLSYSASKKTSNLMNLGKIKISINQEQLNKLIDDKRLARKFDSREQLANTVAEKLELKDSSEIFNDRRWNAGWQWQFFRGKEIQEDNYKPLYENISWMAEGDNTGEQDKLLGYWAETGISSIRLSTLNSILVGIQSYKNICQQIINSGGKKAEDKLTSLPSDSEIKKSILENLLKETNFSK